MQANRYGPVVVISHDVVGRQMAGPGIRCYHLARVLAQYYPVILAIPSSSSLPETEAAFTVLVYQNGMDCRLEKAIREARTVLVSAVFLASIPCLLQTDTPLIIDGYNPFTAETLFLAPDTIPTQLAALTQAYLAGDFFVCAGERQRDWWLGVLESHGRINPQTFHADRSFRRLIDQVPCGLPQSPPQHTRKVIQGVWPGIHPEDRLLLWGGGLWPWLDPFTAIQAMVEIWKVRRDIKLIFPGTRHPNPGLAGIPEHTTAANRLAEEVGLLNRGIFFGDWIPYADWTNVLLECTVALTLHVADTLEAHFAFRSRVLDYIWAGLPVVATEGDATSELICRYGLGRIVKSQDAIGVARAVLELIDQPAKDFIHHFSAARHEMTWEQAAKPLVEFCRMPKRAPDKEAMAGPIGNAFYLNSLACLQEHLTNQERMTDEWRQKAAVHEERCTHLSQLVTAYQRMKLVRLTHRLQPYWQQWKRWKKLGTQIL